MSNTLSNKSISQTRQAYANASNYDTGLSQPIIQKTAGDYIAENKYKILNILFISGITYMILLNNQPALVIESQ